MVTNFEDLFVYVPKGSGSKFIKSYATTDKYALKIAFIEDTKEIWTNGLAFGASNATDLTDVYAKIEDVSSAYKQAIEQEVTDRNDAIAQVKKEILGDSSALQETLDTLAEIDTWITTDGAAAVALTTSVADLNAAMATLNGADTTEGSVDYKIKVAVDSLKSASDASINELADQEAEDVSTLNAKIAELTATNTKLAEDLASETARAEKAEKALKESIDSIKAAQVWSTFAVDEDAPEITEETNLTYSSEDLTNLVSTAADTKEEDVVVANNDALSYFSNSSNANVTFKNISL